MTASPVSADDVLDALGKIQHNVGEAVGDPNRFDPGTAEKLLAVLQEAQANENFWATSSDAPKWTAFVLYHAWRNVALIVGVMKGRLDQAASSGGGAALDGAANLLPSLLSTVHLVHDAAQSQASKEELSRIIDHVARLRIVARLNNMAPSMEQELNGVDKETLRKVLDQVAERVLAKRPKPEDQKANVEGD